MSYISAFLTNCPTIFKTFPVFIWKFQKFVVPLLRSDAFEMQLHLISAFVMPRGLQIPVIICGCIANAPELDK